MLEVLLDNRYRLVKALAHPESGGPDPVRILFLDEWNRLGEIIRAAAGRGTLGDRSLEFLGFISAGDALFALDQASPALGMHISADDLRRLAHIMAPMATGDPLNFSFDEDPELQKLFGITKPLESEGPLEAGPTEVAPAAIATPSAIASGAIATSTATAAATKAAPAATGTSQPPPASNGEPAGLPNPEASPGDDDGGDDNDNGDDEVGPSSMLRLLEWSLTPAPADAAQSAQAGDVTRKLQELGGKLKRVVVSDRNADQYRDELEQLIQLGGLREMNQADIDPPHRGLYTRLVKAAAWQESCWRQFRLRGNKVVFLESSTHDLGLMQVNKDVWRGFYSIPRLEWDIIYNAGAGMEILAQLLGDLEARRGATSPGKPDDLARSAYAAYNGGPGSYRRWRGREAHELRLIDQSFWEKYQAVSRGQTINILSCAADWDRSH